MQLERRYIIIMSLCFAFLVFVYSSGGGMLIGKFISVPVDRTDLRDSDYFANRDFSGTRYEKKVDSYFKELGAPELMNTVFFYKKQSQEGPLNGGLALQDYPSLSDIKDKQLKLLLAYGIDRVEDKTISGNFNTYDFRLGYKNDLYLSMEFSKAENRLTVRDHYDTIIGFHNIDGLDLEALEQSLIEDLPFLFDAQITKLPFSENHVIVKSYVDEAFNFSKKEGFEKLIAKKTGATYVSVLYSHRGTIVDITIAEDPSIKSLFLHENEILYYYNTEQIKTLLDLKE